MVQRKPGRGGRAPVTKKTNLAPQKHDEDATPTGTQATNLQQTCLEVFRNALNPINHDPVALQEVKGHLYKRDFASAFGRDEYLHVYAERWSPGRALGYLAVFTNIQEYIHSTQPTDQQTAVVCLGGGAGAEVVALGAWLTTISSGQDNIKLHGSFVDLASWSHVVSILHSQLITAPEISEYASDAARQSKKALLSPETYSATFIQQDVLVWSDGDMSEVIHNGTKLVTLFFTLNELYTTSIPKTQHLLSQLAAHLSPGSLILVVDSPGSYSTVQINGAEKKYPMQWLLDYTLLNKGKSSHESAVDKEAKWDKIISEDSKWFRLPSGLRFPIKLENMRYQIHLYRRLAG
ncbi:hypothetical protein LTR62_001475 [Meristemomyces frigidus]|uniref:25S rRNA (Uridine(2843)-N(3))-methyltransferase n=1 Tax=Meristemomyces frigidus TaxID=1508187 RepID=A0AAN7TND8_9PEZI|nr:hypothetical protein LTR62_001475 [Meristemomyces frigidus]